MTAASRAQPPIAPHRDIEKIVAFPSKLPAAMPAAISFVDDAEPAMDDRSARVIYLRYTKKKTRMHNDRAHRLSRSSLMAANPGFSVIDCVANCIGIVGAIVYFQPRISTATGQPVKPGGGIQTVAQRAPADDAIIACLAGCYSTPKRYAARPAPPPSQSAAIPTGIMPVSHAMTTSGEMIPPIARLSQHKVKPARHQRRASLRKLRARVPAVWQTQMRAAPAKPAWVVDHRSFRPNYRVSYRAY